MATTKRLKNKGNGSPNSLASNFAIALFTAKALAANIRRVYPGNSPLITPIIFMLRYCIFSVLLGTLCLAGCQQPSAGGGRQAAFDLTQRPNLFNFGGNQPANGSQYAQNGPNGWGAGGGQTNFGNSGGLNPQQNGQFANLSEQVSQLNGRLGRFNSDNQQLVTELAAMKQKLQVANDYNYQIKQQLADSTTQLQQMQTEKSAMGQQLANAQFQIQQGGPANNGGARFASATLRANNSLMQKLPQIQIPGAQARMDGDVIRVEIPTDQLFSPGTYQVNAAHAHILQNLASAISQNFPQQIVGIEGHWDGTQVQPATTTHHQLTASHSLAVFEYFTRLGIPQKQMFSMALGSNRPRHPKSAGANGIQPNRRIEIVIYPESYE